MDWKEYHVEDCTWETATCAHVAHQPRKCYCHYSTEPDPHPKGRNYIGRRRGKRSQKNAQGSQRSVRVSATITSEILRNHTHVRMASLHLLGPSA